MRFKILLVSLFITLSGVISAQKTTYFEFDAGYDYIFLENFKLHKDCYLNYSFTNILFFTKQKKHFNYFWGFGLVKNNQYFTNDDGEQFSEYNRSFVSLKFPFRFMVDGKIVDYTLWTDVNVFVTYSHLVINRDLLTQNLTSLHQDGFIFPIPYLTNGLSLDFKIKDNIYISPSISLNYVFFVGEGRLFFIPFYLNSSIGLKLKMNDRKEK
ncbi:MAG: hypothetical protein JXR36_11625 [Bacteroidales bacterium]|nr:hypothetical protein [Bacteroidales bacterium]